MLEEYSDLALKAGRISAPDPVRTFTLNETPEASYRPTVERAEEEASAEEEWYSLTTALWGSSTSVVSSSRGTQLPSCLMSLAPCPVLSFLPRPCLVHLAYVSQKAAHLSDPVWPWVWIEPPRQYNRSFTLVWTQQLDTQNLWKLLGKYLPTGSQPCLEISFGLLVSGPQREVTVGTWQETQRQALTSTCLFSAWQSFHKNKPL